MMKKEFILLGAIIMVGVGSSLLSCQKDLKTPPGKENLSPKASAGYTQIISLPQDSVLLDGSGSTDADGYIVSFTWAEVSGPRKADIQDPHEMQTLVKCLTEGDYWFELTVIDDGGLMAKDEVIVRVDK